MAQSLDNLSRTWSDAGTTFTAIKYDITDSGSAAGSLLLDLRTNSTSRFKVAKSGAITVAPGTAAAPGLVFSDDAITGFYKSTGNILDLSIGGAQTFRFSANGLFFTASTGQFQLSSAGALSWTSGTAGSSTADVFLARDAANTLAQRNGANGQTFRIYGRYTDGSNYERFYVSAPTTSGDTVLIGTDKLGVGQAARALAFQTDGVTRLTIQGNGTVDVVGGLSMNAGQQVLWPSRIGLFVTDVGILRITGGGSTFNRIQLGGTDNTFPALKRSSAALQVRLADDSANAALESASVKTDAPAGGTSGTWKLGVAASVSPTSPNRTIEVDIGGTIYYIAAKTTND
jgi:hypothetical protein